MLSMLPKTKIFVILAAALCCACALPRRKPAVTAVQPPPVAQVQQKAPVAPLSREDENKVEGLYYKAVGAYSNNAMDLAQMYLDQIAAIYPAYAPAAELRGKIKSVTGGR